MRRMGCSLTWWLSVLCVSLVACADATDENETTSGIVLDQDQGLGVSTQNLINGMKYPARTFGFVLVDIGMGMNLTKEKAQQLLFGTDPTNPAEKSLKQYYNEASYGTQDISGEILGPFKYDMGGRCDNTGMARTLKPMIGKYDHYLWYFGSRTQSCQFSGLAEGGQPDRPTNDTWYNGSANCVVLIQEPGHNFGMMHSSSMTCGGMDPFADDPENSCEHNEYGDRYDPMGGSCNHMNAWQKVFEGWLQECNGLRLKSSGMYTLQPLEPACDGPQVLQIPMPKVRPFMRAGGGGFATEEKIAFYYLELRTPKGADSTMRIAPTVLVHVAEEFRSRKDYGRHTWILDMDPSTPRTIDGMGMGKSYTDPAGGVSFKVVALSNDSATIEVTIPNGTGPAMCLDGKVYDPEVPRLCAGIVGSDGKPADPTMTPAGTGTTGTPGMPGTGTTVMPPPPPRVEQFVLVDADTDKDIRVVEDMAVLDLSQLPPHLTMKIYTDPMTVGSVVFRIDAGMPRIENVPPYSVSSHNGTGNFPPWMLREGAHTVNAVAWDAPNGTGRQGEPFEIDFTLTRSIPVMPLGAAGTGAPPMLAVGGPAAGGGALPGTGVNSVVAAAGNVAIPTGAIPGTITDTSGCGCHVIGAGAPAPHRGLALAVLALGLVLLRRRRLS